MKSLSLLLSGMFLSAIIVGGIAAVRTEGITYDYEVRLEDAQKEIHALQHEMDPAHTRFTHGEGAAVPAESHAHHHETPIELADTSWNPSVQLAVTPDPVSGWNVHLQTDDFRFSPEHSGQEHIEGEGHAHLHIDGIKIARLYGNWFHLPFLAVGTHELKVTLTSNNHHPLTKDGTEINALVGVSVE